MRILPALLTATLVAMPVVYCQAQGFDGKRPFLCSTIDVASCSPGESCTRESAEADNVPQFFMIDVGKASVSATDTGATTRVSKIERIERLPQLLRLSGGDGDTGWIATIGQESGKMSLAVIRDQVGFVIFGACLLQ